MFIQVSIVLAVLFIDKLYSCNSTTDCIGAHRLMTFHMQGMHNFVVGTVVAGIVDTAVEDIGEHSLVPGFHPRK